MVLIERRIDRRDLRLAERVVEGLVDHPRGDAQARGGGAVDDERRLQALVLLVGVDVGDLGQLRERLAHARLPQPQIRELIGLQGELVLRVGLPPAHANVLNRHEK